MKTSAPLQTVFFARSHDLAFEIKNAVFHMHNREHTLRATHGPRDLKISRKAYLTFFFKNIHFVMVLNT
jgi:hypothetical protein